MMDIIWSADALLDIRSNLGIHAGGLPVGAPTESNLKNVVHNDN